MGNIIVVAEITMREIISRKHFYFPLFLLVLIFAGMSRLSFWGLSEGETEFVLLVPMVGIPIIGAILSVLAAARQIPQEIENRTIYPLLAKPVTRSQFYLGKFLGIEIPLGLYILLTGVIIGVLLKFKGVNVTVTYWQAIILFVLQLALFTSIVLLFSVIMSYSAALIASLLTYYFLSSVGTAVEDMIYYGELTGFTAEIYSFLVNLLPRFDLLNFYRPVIYAMPPQPFYVIWGLVLYASGYTLVILLAGILIFARKEL